MILREQPQSCREPVHGERSPRSAESYRARAREGDELCTALAVVSSSDAVRIARALQRSLRRKRWRTAVARRNAELRTLMLAIERLLKPEGSSKLRGPGRRWLFRTGRDEAVVDAVEIRFEALHNEGDIRRPIIVRVLAGGEPHRAAIDELVRTRRGLEVV